MGVGLAKNAIMLEIDLAAVAYRAMWGYGVDPPSDPKTGGNFRPRPATELAQRTSAVLPGRLQGLLIVERIGWLIRVCAGGLDGVTAGTAESAVTDWRLSRSGHGGVPVRCQWHGETEELEREPVGVAVAAAQLGGDVRYPVQVQDPDDGVADGGLGLVRAADAAGVLAEGDITDVVVHFDGPVAAEVCEQVTGAGL